MEGTQVLEAPIGAVDHEHRESGRIGHRWGLNVHDVFPPPDLFGVADVELQLEVEALVVHEFLPVQCPIATTERHMGALVRRQVPREDDHHVEWLGKLFVSDLQLVDARLDPVLPRGLLERPLRQGAIVQLVPLLPLGTASGRGTGIGEIERRVSAQLGNQGEGARPRHLHGRVVAKMPVEDAIGQGRHALNHRQQPLHHACDLLQLWGQRHRRLVLGLRPFGPSTAPGGG